ncbi:MAG: hypothetical protein KGO49_02075 [Gammaproteobacteria bacterium]|nr:hypothetical protein [Gammaproteobacteria bacterium]
MTQFDYQSGFVAGTLVHTDKGLVPIDQLKVGDLVLSRLESNPDAPNEYKKVINFIKSTSIQKISYVSYFIEDLDDSSKSDGFRYVFCTENHQFYINKLEDTDISSPIIRMGWLASEMLGGLLSYIEGIETIIQDKVFGGVVPLEHNENRTLIKRHNFFAQVTTDDDRSGPLIDFRQGRPIAVGGIWFSDVKYLSPQQEQITYQEDDPNVQVIESLLSHVCWDDYEDYVYNIEVEDSHTYFVEKIGLWVHDASANIS